MIRTILIATTALALAAAGSASAAEIKVSVHGKTEAAIKSELATAAKTVCSGQMRIQDYDVCVQDSYEQALSRFEKLKAAKLASITF
jgi:uncharacterized cupredoxin-like copper-binding protein